MGAGDMCKIVVALLAVLGLAGRKFLVTSTRFGHEPGAYNTPNLVPYDSSEMTYAPTNNKSQVNAWNQYGLTVVVVNDTNVCFSGNTCIKTIGRDDSVKSIFYRIHYDLLETGSTYLFNVFVKLTNSRHDLIQISAFTRHWYKDPSQHNGKDVLFRFHSKSFHKVEDQWLLFSTELSVTQKDKDDFNYLEFFLKIDNFTDYILDAASLTKVHYPDWREQAENYIASYRMGTIVLNLNYTFQFDPAKITVQVKQTRRHFPFGVAVNADYIGGNDSDPQVQRYRDWVEKRVTWAVFINAAKWRGMENAGPDYTNAKFEKVDRALAWLDSKQIKVRGHAIHWNKLKNIPSWVVQSENKTAEIYRRTRYFVNHYKGRFQHWDVLNEYTVSRVYQNWLQREDVLEHLFAKVRYFDPDGKRFTNEWGNLERNYHFAHTVNAVLRLKKRHLIDGIGLQAHLHPKGDSIDMEMIKRRLTIFTSLGVPVWITELTIKHHDPVVRGRLLADCLTLFYGTAGVYGILLWDFAPKATNTKLLPTALTSPDVVNNAAGDKYDETLAGWTTNATLSPSLSSVRAFYGNYDVTVFYDGIEKASLSDVTLSPDNDVVQLNCVMDVSVSLTQQ